MALVIKLKSIADTEQLANLIFCFAQKDLVVLLKGPLGIGKTQITKFLAEFLGVKNIVTSPTFMIFNQYETNYDFKLNHIDAYRLTNQNFNDYHEYLIDNMTVVEWPEKLNYDFKNYKLLTVDLKWNNQNRIATVALYNFV